MINASLVCTAGSVIIYNLRYPGQYFQAETGLSDNYFRDYDGVTGRYIESDPIGLKAGMNTYAYVANNPVGSSDPLGLCAIKLRCGPVKEGSITVGWHCGVIAPNGVEYGLGGGNSSFNTSGTPQPYGGGLPEAARGDQVEYPVTCNCKSCSDVQNCIEAYHDWEVPPGYLATGPNSNTYAHHMIDSCGCHAASTPTGARGYNFGFPYNLTPDNFPPSL